jgi:hypothetical protein
MSRGINGQGGMGNHPGGGPGRSVIANGRFAFDCHHRFHGRHIYGFIPGYGYGYYWYYGDCWVWSDYGWINMCGFYDD